ncbi:signal recognition particle-docking protein FtsY [Fructilactobacillus carniphilus]|uniref:Signal recognition particle receptor FtsY n=1 Tax=Fructilactobacillus carniphilus TaxID=2940297 RepID=A0ABY5BZ55_9LACO|nr:signal recognition particle-docking protein FtsY [Fructilactobacillus carniphilus]USS91125.1 signal recognition particle-docking protein FtsY [Fructilactobacillus carniphilus]
MGLFDIFKRKNQNEHEQPEQVDGSESISAEQSQTAESDAAQSETTAAVSTEQSTASTETAIASASESASSQANEASTATESESTTAESTTETASETAASAEKIESESAIAATDEVATSKHSEEPEQLGQQTPQAAEQKYEHGLSKSRSSFGQSLNRLFANFRSVDEDFFDDLEDTLIQADVGVNTATEISDQLRDAVRLNNIKKRNEVQNFIVQKLVEIYDVPDQQSMELQQNPDGTTVILMIGVNGAGKTTTIGKLANQYRSEGEKVLVAAADTFRAGAIEQLAEWARRDQVDIVQKPEGSDPASVVFDAVKRAKDEDYDILLVDTAGRLQNKVNLMKELEKMNKIIHREIPGAPQEVLLVIDATVGQNALTQAKLFRDVADITGIVLTKLDGTAKGGIVLAIKQDLGIPVKYVGLGEGVNDLQTFNPEEFVYGLFKGLIKE